MDAIPIQDLVDAAEARGVDFATDIIMAEIATLTGPLAGILLWLMNFIARPFIHALVAWIVKILDFGLFKLNMDVVVSDQGADYRAAEAKVERAKSDPTVTDDQWEAMENEADHKFRELFNYTH